uniref:Uncharacterized protein n=1 Tax=Oryza sativa subsp. japonica TaxID=39947 RepID=Q651S3_ORYSJ|nr:hypothetical protein [Oryza sativa Japonica Group]
MVVRAEKAAAVVRTEKVAAGEGKWQARWGGLLVARCLGVLCLCRQPSSCDIPA